VTAPWLVAKRGEDAPAPLSSALRRVEAPSPAPSSLFGARPGMAPASASIDDSAARELAAVQAQLAQLRTNAEDEGRAAGRADLDATREKVELAARALLQARSALVGADAATIVDLALEVANALLGRVLAADRDALAATVTRALKDADAPAPVLHIHPADADAIAAIAPAGLEIEHDPGLKAGEIRVETARAVIDATTRARLEAMREPLIAALTEGTC